MHDESVGVVFWSIENGILRFSYTTEGYLN
jgi:hypothetical protein